MAVQYALVADNGEVQHVISPGHDNDYTNGQVYDGLTAIEVSSDVDAMTLIHTKYYVNGAWQTRVAQTSPWQDWSGTAWTFNSARFWLHIRQERDMKLMATDWTQMPDVTFSTGVKAAWTTYRQALRNVPASNSTVASIDDVVWPNQPE